MSKYKIFLIDDEEEIINALTRALRDEMYEISSSTNAEKALQFIEKNEVDLIICDYRLGKTMNGVELLEKVAKNKPDIITILLTGYADLKIAMDAINRVGLYKFMLKPWDNDDLLIAVKRALEQRDLIMENRQLIQEIKKRDLFIEQLEGQHPGITKVKKDSSGRIILE